MTLTSQLLAAADAFAAARGLSRSRVSTLALNDGKRLDAIARGGDLRTGVFERAMAWFSLHWPEGAAWPAEVPRPDLPAPDAPRPFAETSMPAFAATREPPIGAPIAPEALAVIAGEADAMSKKVAGAAGPVIAKLSGDVA